MSRLTEIHRFRLSIDLAKRLTGLKRFGINKSKFVRDAIKEKLQKDCPRLLAAEKRKNNAIKIPF